MVTPIPKTKVVLVPPLLGTVLVIEEMPAVANLTVRLLLLHGWDARACNAVSVDWSSFAEERGPADVIVVDANLCTGSRWLKIERLLARHPRAAIVLTMTGIYPDLADSLEARTEAVLAKPYSPDELVRAVRKAQEAGPVFTG